jgi:cell division protein FtsL
MTRISAALVAVLMGCALSLVSSQYQARRLVIDLEAAQSEQRQLDVQWNQLQLDQANWSKHSLIEAAATHDLHMVAPTAARIQYITLAARHAELLPVDATANGTAK